MFKRYGRGRKSVTVADIQSPPIKVRAVGSLKEIMKSNNVCGTLRPAYKKHPGESRGVFPTHIKICDYELRRESIVTENTLGVHFFFAYGHLSISES